MPQQRQAKQHAEEHADSAESVLSRQPEDAEYRDTRGGGQIDSERMSGDATSVKLDARRASSTPGDLPRTSSAQY